jgi:P-type E1-E2 ATPase
LTPGDKIKIELNQVIPCDLVLVKGSCTVDETMLTGESAPVTKSDVGSYETPTDIFDPEKHKLHSSHILNGGTTVI